jgi:uncharacterized membrane protein
MHKSRLEAFSDGVIAIIITILVLELKVPHGSALKDLTPLTHVFIGYVLSFIYLAIYWNNHHHLFHAVKHVNGSVLWANIHLLFWLSLIPFTTGWMGEGEFEHIPTALYGFVLLMAGTAYYILVRALIRAQGKDSVLAKAIGKDLKGKISVVVYFVSIPIALYSSIAAFVLYSLVAAIWIIPDQRIEKLLT